MKLEGRALLDMAGEANLQENFALLEDKKAPRIQNRRTEEPPKSIERL